MSQPVSRPAVAFQVGGAIRKGRAYVARSADEELPRLLLEGDFCYVLAPRQIGKSSLKVRTIDRLEAEGVRTVDIDITVIGTREGSEDEWYNGLLDEITEQLDLEADLDTFLEESAKLTPVHRWSRFLRRVVLEELEHQRVVVFIDEIDSILGHQDLSSDDFFASIRATFNQRSSDDVWERLTFCLLGVAAPTELMDDPQRTPFNIGRPIHLLDFSPPEAEQLLPALREISDQPEALLAEVLAWTDGHPYLTQMLCDRLGKLDGGSESASERVEAVVGDVFFKPGAPLEINLQTASDRLLRARSGTPAMLSLYRRVRSGDEVVVDDRNEIHQGLRLTGMVAVGLDGARSILKPRNRIFAETFDLDWVEEQEKTLRPFSEVLTQWLRKDRDDDFVLRGRALEEARAWARERRDLTQEENDFLMQGLEVAKREELEAARREERQRAAEQLLDEERRGAKRLKRLVVALLIASVVALAFAVYAVRQRNKAHEAVVRADSLVANLRQVEEDNKRQAAERRQTEALIQEQAGKSAEDLKEKHRQEIEIERRQSQERGRILEELGVALGSSDRALLPDRIQQLTREREEAVAELDEALARAEQERGQVLQDLSAALSLDEKSGQTPYLQDALSRVRELVVQRNDARREAAKLSEQLQAQAEDPPPPIQQPGRPVTVEFKDGRCLPVGDNGVVRARVVNLIPGSTVRLYFRRSSSANYFYYTPMEDIGDGLYRGVLPKTAKIVHAGTVSWVPAMLYVSVYDSEGRRLAKSPTRLAAVTEACRVKLSPQELEEAASLTVGETSSRQHRQQPAGWLCDGIVNRIDAKGVLHTDDVCAALVAQKSRGKD